MKARTREKRIKESWWYIARKLPATFRTKKEQKRWVSFMSRRDRKEERDRKRSRRRAE